MSSCIRSPHYQIRCVVTAVHPVIAAIVIATLGVFPGSNATAAIHSRFPPIKLDPNIPVPTITFDQTRYDFGQIATGQKVAHAFIVTNTGRALLRIEKPHASCGCTTATIGEQELKPGESTQIVATYTAPERFTGAMRKSVLVISNDPIHGKLTLRLAGNVFSSAKSESASHSMPPIPHPAANGPSPETAKPQISK